jgi:hypothetical protein
LLTWVFIPGIWEKVVALVAAVALLVYLSYRSYFTRNFSQREQRIVATILAVIVLGAGVIQLRGDWKNQHAGTAAPSKPTTTDTGTQSSHEYPMSTADEQKEISDLIERYSHDHPGLGVSGEETKWINQQLEERHRGYRVGSPVSVPGSSPYPAIISNGHGNTIRGFGITPTPGAPAIVSNGTHATIQGNAINSGTVQRGAVGAVAEQPPAPVPTNNCPNGICISGGQVDHPTVNNFGAPPPEATWGVESIDNTHPGIYRVKIWVQMKNDFLDPGFIAYCDRPCSADLPDLGGVVGGTIGNLDGQPEAAYAKLTEPSVVGNGSRFTWWIQSKDGNPITVTGLHLNHIKAPRPQ